MKTFPGLGTLSRIVTQFVPDPTVPGPVFGAAPWKFSVKLRELVRVVVHTEVVGLQGTFTVSPPAEDTLFTAACTSDSLLDAAVYVDCARQIEAPNKARMIKAKHPLTKAGGRVGTGKPTGERSTFETDRVNIIVSIPRSRPGKGAKSVFVNLSSVTRL